MAQLAAQLAPLRASGAEALAQGGKPVETRPLHKLLPGHGRARLELQGQESVGEEFPLAR